MIICAGSSAHPASGNYTAAGFDAAVSAALDSAASSVPDRKIDPGRRPVWVGEGFLARDSAKKILQPCSFVTEALLNEVPVRSFTDTEKMYPAKFWIRKAAAQRKYGDPRQKESQQAVVQRADTLIRRIEGTECILLTYPLFLSTLLDRLRFSGYVIQRTGFLAVRPFERFIISHREEHCGGCQHNCFLSSPGCGVGRDKAMRLKKK